MTGPERLYLFSKSFDLAKQVLQTALTGWIFWTIYLDIRELAGKETEASFLFQYFISKDNDYGMPWIIAGAALLYARVERSFRLKKTKQLTERIQELERRIDPNRSSSGLTPTGETNPNDRI